MLRRIASAALAACGQNLHSFISYFKYEDEARSQAMHHLFVQTRWTRIQTLLGFGSDSECKFDDRRRPQLYVHIPDEIINEAAGHFYGENTFVAETATDISLFTQVIEPGLSHHVRHLVLEDSVLWRPFGQARDENGFTKEDRILLKALDCFPGLQRITFNFSWHFEGPHYGNVIRQICVSRPVLRTMEIRRPEPLGTFPHLAIKSHLLKDDLHGMELINAELEAKWDSTMDIDGQPGRLELAGVGARWHDNLDFGAGTEVEQRNEHPRRVK
ncbi:hypothetical protein MMC30_007460 [Trapelia coarctata]|nr:hypothetical protein [Trapelia coarctata]